MPRALGIDISKWDVAYSPPASGGADFVIQRASYGMKKDELFDALYPGVYKTPIRGAYHYMSSAAGWKVQADWFLSVVTPCDFHFYACDFEGAFNNLTLNFVSETVEWMRYVKAMTGKPVILYTGYYLYIDYISKDSRVTEFPFWISRPLAAGVIPDPQTYNPSMPPMRSDWKICQYSLGEHNALGKQYGVGRTGVDVDVYNGSVDDMRSWLKLPANIITPPELTTEEKVERLWLYHVMHGDKV